jgi:thioesterase domain-containing protein/NRPS condensation-like uncharacterized protein/acyl carrier protein
MSIKTLDNLLLKLRQLEIKLWLEGDILRCKASDKNVLTPSLISEIKAYKQDIIAFLKAATKTTKPSLSKVAISQYYPLSFAQKRFWLEEQFNPGQPVSNVPLAYRFNGSLDLNILQKCLKEIIQRQEILRANFHYVDGEPCQSIGLELPLILPIEDLSQISLAQRESKAQHLASIEAQQPFDLVCEPLFRFRLLQLGRDEHILLLNMHHIICDGWSSEVFFQELTALYAAFSVNKPSPLPELPIQYVDFAHWQRQWMNDRILDSQLKYWKQQLAGNLPFLQLPIAHPRPFLQTNQGKVQREMLSAALTEKLKAFSQQSGATLSMILLAAFKVLIYRYSGQEDLIVGLPIAGRTQVEVESLIGLFVNTLVIRTNLSSNLTFNKFLEQVRLRSLEAYENQDVPFDKLVEELKPDRRYSPIFQMMFAMNPPWTKGATRELEKISISSTFGYVHTGMAKFDLSLIMRDTGQGLRVSIEYNTDLFDDSTITSMLGHFQTLLEGIVANPNIQIVSIPFLSSTDKEEIWLRTKIEQNGDETINYPMLSNSNKLEVKSSSSHVASDDQIEQQLVQIWGDMLGIKEIGIKDNFFDLGGHSLLAVRLFVRIEQVLGTKLPVSTILQSSTIELLANSLHQEEAEVWSPLVTIQTGSSKPPLFCIHGGGFNVLIYRDLAVQLGSEQPVYGLQARGLIEDEPLEYRIESMASDYIQEIKKLQPQGPYMLAGLSNGGNIALEMAQQLLDRGEKVSILAMFDTYGPNSHQLLSPFPRLLSSLSYFLEYSIPRFARKSFKQKQAENISSLFRFLEIFQTKPNSLNSGISDDIFNVSNSKPFSRKLLYNRLEEWSNRVSIFILKYSPWSFLNPSTQLKDVDNNLVEKMKKMENNYTQAQKAYVTKPYAGSILLFRAVESPPGYWLDPQLGWGNIAKQGVEIHKIPGHHTSLLQSYILARIVKTCIDRAIQDNL